MASYSDDFNRASLGTGWTAINSGTWVISGSTVLQQTEGTGTYRALRYNSPLDSADIDVSLDIRTGTAYNGRGIIIRMPDSGTATADLDGYAIVAFGQDAFYIVRFDNGDDGGVGYGYVWGTVADNTDYTLRITAVGSTITGYVDGVERFSFTDTTYAGGSGNRSAAILSYGGTTQFDNFSAADVGGAATLLPVATDAVTVTDSNSAAFEGSLPNLTPTATDAVTVAESQSLSPLPGLVNSATATVTAATGITIAVPSGTQDGDVMLAAIWAELNSPTWTPPSGWDLVFQTNVGTRTGNLIVYSRVAASEPADYTWTTTSSEKVGGIATFRGVAGGTLVSDSQGNNTSTTTNTAPTVTVATLNSLVVHVGGLMRGTTRTGPTNYEEIFDVNSGTGKGNTSIAMAYQPNMATGATGTVAATWALADYNVAGQIVLAPFVGTYSATGSDAITTGDSAIAEVAGGAPAPLSAVGTDAVTAGDSTSATLATLTRSVTDSVTTSDSGATQIGAHYSLRFYGNGVSQIDRVRIPLEDGVSTQYPVNVGAGSFTYDIWLRCNYADNTSTATDEDVRYSNIVLDRDSWAEQRGHVVLGVTRNGANLVACFGQAGSGGTWTTIFSTSDIGDGEWHHVAVTRNISNGQVIIWVDGVNEASGTYDTTNWSFPAGHTVGSGQDNEYLVVGTEKHDVGYGYNGEVDELRISNTVRYSTSFTPATYYLPDANAVGIYHSDTGTGTTWYDNATVSGAPTNGELLVGGSPSGPVWVALDTALMAAATDSITTGETVGATNSTLAVSGTDAISTGETQGVQLAAAASLSATGASTATIADSADGRVSIGAAGASAATIGESASASLPLIQSVVSSTATFSDSVGVTQSTLLATAADSVTLADSAARSLPIAATVTDSAATTDSTGRLLLLQRAATDAVATTDSTNRLLLSYRNVTDAAAAADSLNVAPLAIAASSTDALAAADNGAAAIPTLFAAGSDVVVAADQALAAPLAISAASADAASSADSLAVAPLGIFTATTDAATTGESQALTVPIAAQATDGASATDGIAVTPLAVSATATDASTIADTATVDLPLNALAGDAMTTGDAPGAVHALDLQAAAQSAAAVADSGFTSVQTPGIFTIFAVDNVTVGESTERVASLAAASASAATVSDAAGAAAPYTDNRLAASADAISVGESAAAVVQEATGFAPNASDGATLSDSAQATISSAQAIGVDAIAVVDTATAAIDAPGAFSALGSDAVVAADQPFGAIGIAASASDGSTAVDGTTVAHAALTAMGADGATLADSGAATVAAAGTLNVSGADALAVGESLQHALGVAAAGADAAAVADSGAAYIEQPGILAAIATDTVTTGESTTGFLALLASGADAATLTDGGLAGLAQSLSALGADVVALGETVAAASDALLSSSTDAVVADDTAAAATDVLAASATDAIAASDTAGAAIGTPADFEVSATDVITTADSGLAGDLFLAAIGVTAIVVVDSTDSVASLNAAASDAATLVDGVQTYYNDPHAFEASVTDAVSTADGALTQPLQLLTGVIDAASFVDALAMLLNRPTAGQWTVTDLSLYLIQVSDASYVEWATSDRENTAWTVSDGQV